MSVDQNVVRDTIGFYKGVMRCEKLLKVGNPIGSLGLGVASEDGIEGENGAGASERRELLEKLGSFLGHSGDAVEGDEAHGETLVGHFFLVGFVVLDDVVNCIKTVGGDEAADDDGVDFGLAAEVGVVGEELEVGD